MLADYFSMVTVTFVASSSDSHIALSGMRSPNSILNAGECRGRVKQALPLRLGPFYDGEVDELAGGVLGEGSARES